MGSCFNLTNNRLCAFFFFFFFFFYNLIFLMNGCMLFLNSIVLNLIYEKGYKIFHNLGLSDNYCIRIMARRRIESHYGVAFQDLEFYCFCLCIMYSCNLLAFHMEIVHLNKPYQIYVQIRLKLNHIPFHCQFELLPFPFTFLSSIKLH